MLLAHHSRSLLASGDGKKERGQHGMVNASVVCFKLLHVGQNSSGLAQVLKMNGFDSWGTSIR
jgi:hypothetical protein